jgi:hypothetical protein
MGGLGAGGEMKSEIDINAVRDRIQAKKNRRGPTQETVLKRDIKKFLTTYGWFHFPITQGLGSQRGIPDICAVKNGRTVWLEVKSAKGVQSDYQKEFQWYLEHHGGEYFIIKSIEDLLDAIRGCDRVGG